MHGFSSLVHLGLLKKFQQAERIMLQTDKKDLGKHTVVSLIAMQLKKMSKTKQN